MLTMIFWKKVWIWVKHHWYWPVIIILMALLLISRSGSKEKLFELLEKQKESYEKEVAIINKANEEKSVKKNKILERHKEEMGKIEKEYDVKLGELKEEKQMALAKTIEENKNKPDELAREVAKILSAEYFEKNR